jgi:hypothetical protein
MDKLGTDAIVGLPRHYRYRPGRTIAHPILGVTGSSSPTIVLDKGWGLGWHAWIYTERLEGMRGGLT